MIKITKNMPCKRFNNHWQFCVGSPHATYALRRDYYEQLKTVHDELGIQQVRFHGIFCDDMHTLHKLTDLFPIPGGNSVTEQSFRWCAAAYDNILAAGMKPFVELSFMPRHLAKKNKKGMFFYKPCISPPMDKQEWSEYIKSFIRFLIDRYGEDEIETWYFEVWNEPDLKLPFFAGSQKDYFELYAVTVKAIKSINKNIKTGGPSTSGSKWVREFIGYCKCNNIPLDFITTHQYAGDPLGGIDGDKDKAKININPFAAMGKNKPQSFLGVFRKLMATDKVYDSFKKDNLINSAANARRQTGTLPLYYTEWNLCASFSAECNDTRMVAAYDVHSILGTSDTVDGSSIWCFTDLFEELHPFADEFHGGFGIMTQSGIRKPVFHALKFLADAGENRIVLDEQSEKSDIAAFRTGDDINIIATLPVLSKDNRQSEKLSFAVECDKPVSVKLSRIDENNANPYAVWQSMGAPQVPTKSQVDEINNRSSVCSEEIPFEYKDGFVYFDFIINDNDVIKAEIKT